MNKWMRFLLSLVVAISSSYGAIYDHVSQLPSYDYDYIIVGSGAAGNVLANRLTEYEHIRVLVLEAGGSNEGVIASIVPLMCVTLGNTQYDWNYTTTPQSGCNGRSLQYTRGKILGGSTSINYMVYNTGSKDDWDHISSVTQDESWKWDAMAKYRDRNQHFVPPNDGHDDTNQYLPSAHSRKGVVPMSLPGYPAAIDSKVLAAASEPDFASDFPFQRDMNIGNPIGVGWVQGTIANGTRSSSATTYVGPEYINRPNLHILLHAQATKILEATNTGGDTIPTFNGVEFGHPLSDERWQVYACKEVIISAGVFNSPQLLMLSGIGDTEELTSMGIPTRVNLPSVGKNMTDHTLLANNWQVNNNNTFNAFLSADLLPLELQEWNSTNPHQGPLSWTVSNQMAWLRLPENSTIIQTYGDPSAGPTSAHIQIIWADGWINGAAKPDGNWISMITNIISPTSRGTVKLRSSNPFDPPLIDMGFLTTDFDVQTMVYAVKLIKRFATANAWKGFVIGPWGPLGSANTDQEIVEYIRSYASTVLHAVGTVAMSPCGAQWGVLDPDFRVKGTKGLRVVDASAFPYVPTAHTQGPTYLLAEAAAEKIKQKWCQ